MEDFGIIIGSGTFGALCAVVTTWIKSRVGTKIKRPLDSDDTFVTHAECREFRCQISKRIDEIGPALNRIFVKLAEIDQKSEERAIATHKRLDPILEKCAQNAAEVDMLKKVVLK